MHIEALKEPLTRVPTATPMMRPRVSLSYVVVQPEDKILLQHPRTRRLLIAPDVSLSFPLSCRVLVAANDHEADTPHPC